MNQKPLGRLVKVLGEKCLECSTHNLQHRERTLDNNFIENYKYCPNCQNETRFPYKEKGRRHGDKKHKTRD